MESRIACRGTKRVPKMIYKLYRLDRYCLSNLFRYDLKYFDKILLKLFNKKLDFLNLLFIINLKYFCKNVLQKRKLKLF